MPQAHVADRHRALGHGGTARRLPLYQLLGGARDKYSSYASTPLLADDEAYIDYVAERQEEGFKAIKFHCWCEPARDLPMCEAVHAAFRRHRTSRSCSTSSSATTAIRRPWHSRAAWSELGLHLVRGAAAGYRHRGLSRAAPASTVPIIAAGNTGLELSQIAAQALQLGAWSAPRVDATICGGITPTRKIMALAEAHGMTCEMQCWGYTLTQAANLHVMLAYAELPLLRAALALSGLRVWLARRHPHRQGWLRSCAAGRGLGIEVDWPAIERASLLHFEQY